jgi:hypothetical protein
MQKEERAFRQMMAEVLVAGPEELTSKEIHTATGISHIMVAKARKAVKQKAAKEARGEKFGTVFCALARRKRKTALSPAQIRRIANFFEAKSTPTANKRDVKRCLVNGVRELHQKRLLSHGINKLHKEYVRSHGPIARGLFFAHRPQWVVPPTDDDRRVCLCSMHTHVQFAMEDAAKNCKRCSLPFPSLEHYTDFFNEMLCEVPTLACIKEECDDCGLESLEHIFKPLKEAQDVTFKYRR